MTSQLGQPGYWQRLLLELRDRRRGGLGALCRHGASQSQLVRKSDRRALPTGPIAHTHSPIRPSGERRLSRQARVADDDHPQGRLRGSGGTNGEPGTIAFSRPIGGRSPSADENPADQRRCGCGVRGYEPGADLRPADLRSREGVPVRARSSYQPMFVAHGPRDERFRSVARRRRARVGRPVTPRPERRVPGNRRQPLALRDRGRCKGPNMRGVRLCGCSR